MSLNVNPTSFSFFYPKIPSTWTFEKVKEIQTRLRPLRFFAEILNIIGKIGLVVTAYRACKVLMGFIKLPPNLFLWGITYLSLCIIRKYIHKLADRHLVGLNDEILAGMAAQKLKKVFESQPVFATQNDLDERLNNDPNFNLKNIEKNLRYVESLVPFNSDSNFKIIPLYRPTKEIHPHFCIRSNRLSNKDKLDLLKICFPKGITLQFVDNVYNLVPSLALQIEKSGFPIESSGLSEDLKKSLLKSHQISVLFLKECIQNNEKNTLAINRQLESLSFRLTHFNLPTRAFKPTIYLENDDTIVLRGNCSEIGDPCDTLDELATLNKKIKIQTTGLIDSKSTIHWNCFDDSQKEALQQQLQKKYSSFPAIEVELFNGVKIKEIWQEQNQVRQHIPFTTIFHDIIADNERIKNMTPSH